MADHDEGMEIYRKGQTRGVPTGSGMQPVPWGIALRVAAQRQPGGTLKLVESIQKEVGHGIGSRPTFLNLYRHMADPSLLQTDVERQRAWFLLVAMGEDPATWGVDASCLPDAWHRTRQDIARRIRDRVIDGERSAVHA